MATITGSHAGREPQPSPRRPARVSSNGSDASGNGWRTHGLVGDRCVSGSYSASEQSHNDRRTRSGYVYGRNGPSSPKLDLHTVSVKKEPTSGSAATSTGSRNVDGYAAQSRRHQSSTDTCPCNSASRNSQLPVPQLLPAEVEKK